MQGSPRSLDQRRNSERKLTQHLTQTPSCEALSAVAINLVRIGNWVSGIPTAQTRCSWFAALQKAA
jgi:hypothetical protein